jgi:flagellar FliL protein
MPKPERLRRREKSSVPEFEYYELAPLVLPIITETGVTQQVSLVVSLELPFGKKSEVEPYEPRLADAYLQELYGALGAGEAMMHGNIVDVQAVKSRLGEITTRVLGPDKVNSVLLQVVQQRRL